MGSFGDNLRRQRELRGISLEAISTTTKISTRMLRAIEDEHFDQLPGGVFNKGFVRSYARQVGLDEDEAVADYLAALREGQIHAIQPDFRQPPSPTPHVTKLAGVSDLPGTIHASGQLRPSPRLGNLAVHSKTSQTVESRTSEYDETEDRVAEEPQIEDAENYQTDHQGGEDSRVANRQIENRRVEDRLVKDRRIEERRIADRRAQERRYAEAQTNSEERQSHRDTPNPATIFPSDLSDEAHRTSWIKLAAPLLLIALVFAFWSHHRHGQSAAVSPAIAPAPGSAPTAAISVAPEPVPPLRPAAASIAHHLATPNNLENKLPVAERVPLATKINSPSRFTLVIRATQNSWISITADGQPVASETLIAPANTSVRATREIVVRTRNAAGLSFLLNGKEIPADGNLGESRTYTFDPSGLRASADPQLAPPAQ